MEHPDPTKPVRIQLTPEQAKEVKSFTGREAEAIELTIQELEARVVPTSISTGFDYVYGRQAGNSNETLLVD